MAQAVIGLVFVVIITYGFIWVLNNGMFVNEALGSSTSGYASDEMMVIVVMALCYVVGLVLSVRSYFKQKSYRMLPNVATQLAAPPPYVPATLKPAVSPEQAVAASPESNPGQPFTFCPECGNKLPISKKFCPFCGFNFADASPASPSPVAAAAVQPQPVSTVPVTPTKPPHFVSHGVPLTLICVMMQRRNADVKVQVRFGKVKVEFKDDDFVLKPEMIPMEIAEASRRWDEATVINWLVPQIPRTLERAGIIQAASVQSLPTAGPSVYSAPSPQLGAAQLAGQAAQNVGFLRVFPSKPPRFLSRTPALSCIVHMLLKHKIATRFKIAPRFVFYDVRVVDDDLMLTPEKIPGQIAEAAKNWDEATVINWLAPYIPRAIAKAKMDPQSGIT